MNIPLLNEQQILTHLTNNSNPFFSEYYAFYSSWFGGITTNPHLMLLPIDDHIVHRGDGVFEAIKATDKSIYLLNEHLQRLLKSAELIGLSPPFDFEQIKKIILTTLQVANKNEAIIRVFLSRGPGNFSVNPYDSVKAQLYVAITYLRTPNAIQYEQGVHIGRSTVPIKVSWLSQVKSCNYLPNVLMKKEAVDRGLDFTICFDDKGCVAEGATENIMIVDKEGFLVHPLFDNILKGTTMLRLAELAQQNNIPTKVKSITLEDFLSAKEAMMCGTTLDVLPVRKFEDHIIGEGKPGPLTQRLHQLLLNDIASGIKSTPF